MASWTICVEAAEPTPVAPAFDWRATISANQKLPPGSIDDLNPVKIGGIEQWISVRGTSPDNPLLLYIHGGPGSPMMPESWIYQRPWEDYFTVVQWDQRGAGKTFLANGLDIRGPLTLDRMQADAEELIVYLLKHYHKRKLIVLGHSDGSILGLRIAQHRPDLLYAYVGVGQVVNMQKNEQVGYQLTLAEARKYGDFKAVRELDSIAPYPEKDGRIPEAKTAIERKWDVFYRGMIYGLREDDEIQRWTMSPLYSDADVAAAQIGELKTNEALWSQKDHVAVDFDGVHKLDCPFFLFAGAEDRTTPMPLAKAFFDHVQAPTKRYFEVPKAAHYVIMEAPGVFLVDLVQFVLPTAQ